MLTFGILCLLAFVFFNRNLQHISKNCSWAAGFQENITNKVKRLFLFETPFFFETPIVLAVQETHFFLLPVDLGILYYYILCIRSALKVEVGCLNTFFFQPHLPPTSPDITADLAYHGHVNIVNHVKA